MSKESKGKIIYRSDYTAYVLVSVTILLLYVALTLVTPLYLDDFNFMAILREKGGQEGTAISKLYNFYNYIWENDNGRFANLLSPVMNGTKPFNILFPWLNGIFYVLIIIMAQLLSTAESYKSSPSLLVLSWFFFIIFLPWYDYILVYDYTLNYVWSGALSLLAIYMLLRGETRGWNYPLLIVSILVILVAAGMHEGFSASTLCGLGVLILFRRNKLSPQFYTLFILYLFVSLLVGISPGVLSRLHYTISDPHYLPSKRVWGVTAIYGFCIIGCLFSRKGRQILYAQWKTDIFLITAGILVSGYIIGYFTINEPRCYFFANIASVIMLLQLIYKAMKEFPGFNGKEKWIRNCVIILIFIGCIVQVLIVIYYQNKLGREAKEIYSQLETSKTGIVYKDFENTDPLPWYTLQMPLTHRKIWKSPYQYMYLQRNFSLPFLSIVPQSLQHLDSIVGTDEFLRMGYIRLENGNFVVPEKANYNSNHPTRKRIISDFGVFKGLKKDGSVFEDYVMISPFIVRKDNTNEKEVYYYLTFENANPHEVSTMIELR